MSKIASLDGTDLKLYKSCPTCILHSQNYRSFANFYFVKKKSHILICLVRNLRDEERIIS